MPTKLLAFPATPEGDSEADAYLEYCNNNNPDEGRVFYPSNYRDKYGRRIVAYLGPGGFSWNNLPYPEPSDAVALRRHATIIEDVEWPDEGA